MYILIYIYSYNIYIVIIYIYSYNIYIVIIYIYIEMCKLVKHPEGVENELYKLLVATATDGEKKHWGTKGMIERVLPSRT